MSDALSTTSMDSRDAQQERGKKVALIQRERELHAQTHRDAMAITTSRFSKDIAETGLDDVTTALSTKFLGATEGKAKELADELMGGAIVAVRKMDVASCSLEQLTEHLQKVSRLVTASVDIQTQSLKFFETQVATLNRARSETTFSQLSDFKAKVATVLEARSEAFNQSLREHQAMLYEPMHEEEERIKVLDARARSQLDREQHELQQMLVAGEYAHKLEMRNLQVKAAQGKIDREARVGLQKELATEMESYRLELDLASLAMKNSVGSKRTMKITSYAPKIEWSDPPRVVPGSVSWELR